MDYSIDSTFLTIVIMLLVLLGAYFTTKFLSRRSKRIMKSKYINVLDRMIIAKDKNILLINVGDKHYLLGISNQSVNIIGTIEKDELEQVSGKAAGICPRGFFSGIANFFNQAKEAPNNLKKMRMQAKNDRRQPVNQQSEKEDNIERMIDAIKQRKSRFDSYHDIKEDNE